MDVSILKILARPEVFYQTELPAMPAPRREHGWTSGGLCPFHADRHAGSFYVHLDSGAFKCHACGAGGGDVIAFVRLRDGLSFPDACAYLEQCHE
jgi:hypothetical protein